MSDVEDSVSPSCVEASLSTRSTASPSPGKRKEPMTLPLPSGTLPPRKRAKTKDEKEQRRIERIMRNRQAAHASREKKRRHVEELETKCVNLEEENRKLNAKVSNLSQFKRAMMAKNKAAFDKLSILFAEIKAGNIDKIDTFDLSQVKIKEDEDMEFSEYEEAEEGEHDDETDGQASSLNGFLEVEPSKSPDSLILSTFTAPSLSSSVASSPQSSSDSDEQQDNILPPSEFVSLFETSTMIRTHHPAAVMSSGLQRRSMLMIRYLKTVVSRMSLIC